MQRKICEIYKNSEKRGARKILQMQVDLLIKQLEQVGMLPLEQFQSIVQSSISILKFEPNVIKVCSPTIIVGDLHGQFFDLIAIFKKYGFPPQKKYVFLGDYVDRGDFSIETLTILFWLKLKFPKNIYLLRGNHQCRILTSMHNFKQQCKSKYNLKIYQLVIIMFEVLPLCCIVDNKYFCVHAGISPSFNTIDQVQKLHRFCEIPQKGTICDLLWSDPTDQDKKEWTFNSARSCSYFFSKEHVLNFLKKNNLQMIIRGHEVHLQGYKYLQYNKSNKKNVLTIFSAPNYCDKYNNLGAIAFIQNNNIKIETYRNANHPYVLPNNKNIFQWSIGLISHQAVKILIELLRSRLNSDKQVNNTVESIDRIKQKIQLNSQVEALKKVIEQKQMKQKQQLCSKKQIIKFCDQDEEFEPHKCMISIFMFMSEKKKDQKQEAMPDLGDINLEPIQRQDSTALSDHHNLINSQIFPSKKQKGQYQEIFKNKLGESQNVYSQRYSVVDPKIQFGLNQQIKSAPIFGPKIINFSKISAKKK